MNSKFFILREYAENKSVSKEKICFAYNISYKEFDDSINELLNTDKYLALGSQTGTYEDLKITARGLSYLDEHKVEVAVILASGLGQRMGEITKTTSKCLLTIHNEVLVERLITQLQARGIEKIIVVIGHVKEKFHYLKDKYNVQLIENPEYNTKNTIASLHCAINEIKNKNTYITVGDIYLPENLYHSYEIEPFYAGPWTDDCTNEWTYIYDENNKVYGVNVGGMYDYTVGGFSFHTKEVINKLAELVEADYAKKGTEQYYWEEELVNNFAILPDFYVHKFPSDVIQEFDTVADLNKLNDELIALKEQVNNIFKVSQEDLSFARITNGLTNNSYLLNTKGKKYIVRLSGPSTGLLINRSIEYQNYKMLENCDFIDKMVYFDEKTGLKISEFFEGSSEVEVKNENDLLQSLTLYKKLHHLNIYTVHDVNIINVFKFYLEIMKKHKMKFIYYDFDTALKKCNEIISFIKKFDRPNTFTHGDAGSCNVLKANGIYKLIDFEFAGMADPLTDIALFGFCSNMSIDATLRLFDIYKNLEIPSIDNTSFLKKIKIDKNDDDLKNLIVAYMAIDSIACAIWNLIRITITNKQSYSYGENNLKVFEEYYNYLKASQCI